MYYYYYFHETIRVFSHPSTNQARPCLASEIRRDRARSGWYGRRLKPTAPGIPRLSPIQFQSILLHHFNWLTLAKYIS